MGKDGKPGGGKVVTDSRFAAVHFDPRFQRFPRAKAKVEIDERFAGGRRRRPAAALQAPQRHACRPHPCMLPGQPAAALLLP